MIKPLLETLLIGCVYLALTLLLFHNRSGGDIMFMGVSWLCMLLHLAGSLLQPAAMRVRMAKVFGVVLLIGLMYGTVYTVDQVRASTSETQVFTE